jgi:hypothetical protein
MGEAAYISWACCLWAHARGRCRLWDFPDIERHESRHPQLPTGNACVRVWLRQYVSSICRNPLCVCVCVCVCMCECVCMIHDLYIYIYIYTGNTRAEHILAYIFVYMYMYIYITYIWYIGAHTHREYVCWRCRRDVIASASYTHTHTHTHTHTGNESAEDGGSGKVSSLVSHTHTHTHTQAIRVLKMAQAAWCHRQSLRHFICQPLIYMCMYVRMYVCVYIYMYICTHTHTHTQAIRVLNMPQGGVVSSLVSGFATHFACFT